MEQQTVQPDANAGASPAPVRAEALVASMSDTQRDAWQKTGSLPDHVTVAGSQDDPADSSSADHDVSAASSAGKPVEQAASTDAHQPPASESGTPKEKGAKARNAELDTEIAGLQERLKLRRALREELATFERPRDAKPPVSSTGQPAKAEWERFAAMSDAPQEEDFSTVRDYTIAMSVFVSEKRDAERAISTRHAAALTQHTETVKKTVADAAERIEKYREIDPDLESKIDPQLTEVIPASLVPKGQPIGPQHALMENILRSDFTPQLLVHFSTPEGRAEWGRLCDLGSQSPDAFLRAFGRLEARFEGATSSTPTPKHVSSAPTPPTVLGNRTAESTDAVESAIKSKDVGRYIREANKRELAALRG